MQPLHCLLSETPLASATRLLARLVLLGRERNSVRALLSSNSSLLAAKVTERFLNPHLGRMTTKPVVQK